MGLRGNQVTGNWRKLHSEELHYFYAYQKLFGTSLQRRIMGAVRVERVGEKRNTYRILIWKPE